MSKLLKLVGTGLSCGALVLCVACGSANVSSLHTASQAADSVAASVEGVDIMESQVTKDIETMRSAYGLEDDTAWSQALASSGQTAADVRKMAIDSMVDTILVKNHMSEVGVSVADEDVQKYYDEVSAQYGSEDAWKQALASAGFTEETYRDKLRESMSIVRVEEKLSETSNEETTVDESTAVKTAVEAFGGAKRSSHILLKLADTDGEAKADVAREKATKIYNDIKSGAISFDDAVAMYSEDAASKAQNGDVGWDRLSNFVSEYTDALAALNKGDISEPVSSSFGFHIIKCTDVFEPTGDESTYDALPAEFVDSAKAMAMNAAGSDAYSKWVAGLRESANVQINDMPKGLSYDVAVPDVSASSSEASSSEASSSAAAA